MSHNLNQYIVTNLLTYDDKPLFSNKNRKTGETAMNKDSSRSHSIFTIYIENMEDDVVCF